MSRHDQEESDRFDRLFTNAGLPPQPRAPAYVSENAKLREGGWLPVRWNGTITRLRELGIEVVDKPNVKTRQPINTPGMHQKSLWAPRWAVLVSEADPCNEEAREWALRQGATVDEFKNALETIAIYAKEPRRQMADYVMAIWEPGS